MEFIKNVFKNRRLVWQMSRNDFRNKFSSMSLGTVWGFAVPMIFMAIYYVIFNFVLKSGDIVTPSGMQIPFIIWFLSGFSMWLFISDGLVNATNSIRTYSYLVKKTVFNVDIIPVFTLLSNGIVSLVVFGIAGIVCAVYAIVIGIPLFPNVLFILYIIPAAFIFLAALTRLTSALATKVADVMAVINIFIQIIFWFSAILWDVKILDAKVPVLGQILRFSPFTYLVYGFRQAFTADYLPIITAKYGLYTAGFWAITLLVFLYGNYVFNKNKKDFADVL